MSGAAPNLRVLDRSSATKELDLASELFHRINRIVPPNQDLLTAEPSERVRDVIAKMDANGYSQVPHDDCHRAVVDLSLQLRADCPILEFGEALVILFALVDVIVCIKQRLQCINVVARRGLDERASDEWEGPDVGVAVLVADEDFAAGHQVRERMK